MNADNGDLIAVVPAAGHGSRMGLEIPKQYLPLRGSSVLQCTLDRLFTVSAIKQIVLVIAADDHLPEELKTDSRIIITNGGDTRSQSVSNGLSFVTNELKYCGSVLVHDAARPCVRAADINHLIAEVAETANGGLLAIPVHDTLKRSDDKQHVSATVDRDHVWRAVTPQLFQGELLTSALDLALRDRRAVTDEASAMELWGYKPRLVKSAQDNIKITEPADLHLAETILEAQERE